jgi:hypothetical protein
MKELETNANRKKADPMKSVLVASALAVIGVAGCMPTPTASSGGAPSPAEANCLAAVASQTNASGVSTRSVTPSEAGTSVLVNVPGAVAPWICATDSAGNVTNVMFSGEG